MSIPDAIRSMDAVVIGNLVRAYNHDPMKKRSYRLHNRRRPDRPADGDSVPCPECEDGTLRFDEKYTVPLATGGIAVIPSWICDDCQYGRPVRGSDQPPPLHRSARSVRARSNRQLMKARDVLQRAARTLSKSLKKKAR